MKKLFLCAALICACNTTFAQSTTTTTTFWGSKASGGANIPCKGAVRQICGQITITVKNQADLGTLVEKKTFDADKQMTHFETYVDPRSYQEVLDEIEREKSGSTLPGGFYGGGVETENPEGNNND